MRAKTASITDKNLPTIRTCIACRTSTEKDSLIRIVRTVKGELDIDNSGKLPGRGAYLCKNVDCWENGFIPVSLQESLNLINPPSEKEFNILTKKARDIILESLAKKKVRNK